MSPPIRNDDKLEFEESSKTALPEPRPGRGGLFKASILAILALVCLGASVYWLTSSEEKKEELRNQAAEAVNDAAQGTPLAGIGEILRKAPPPPPAAVTDPVTAPGTLAGRNVYGPVDALAESGAGTIAGQGGLETQAVENQAGASLPKEDSEVKPVFIEELANWLVAKYRPGSRSLDATAQSLNQFGAVTLAGQARGGRSGLLRYAFQPSMLKGLYDIYIKDFMEELESASTRRGLNAKQAGQMQMALAGKAVLWATALESVVNLKDLKMNLAKIDKLGQNVVDINMDLATAVFELDELRENKSGGSQLDAAQMRVDGLAARYRRAVEEHASARRDLIAEIRKSTGQALDNDTLMFIAAWAERRLAQNGDGREALLTCAGLLRDLGRRCAQAGAE